MSNAFDKVMAGLEDARTYLEGGRDGFVVHEVGIPEPDVAAIRGKGFRNRSLPGALVFRWGR